MDSDSNASGGWYISATSGSNTSSPKKEASYNFTAPERGTYYLWALLYGPDESSDAIYIGIYAHGVRTRPALTGQYLWMRVARSSNSISVSNGFSLREESMKSMWTMPSYTSGSMRCLLPTTGMCIPNSGSEGYGL
jgi:hypothetical protein